MEQESVKSHIESLLFVSTKPLTPKELAKLLEVDEPAVRAALSELFEQRKESGVVVLENSGEYQMATNPANSTVVKNFLNLELREKLTDATVEVFAIIAYRQPISKAEIESIRGVNSQYSLRNLLMRGLIEKIPNPNDARGFLYQTTTEALMHMGLNSINDLPEFEKLVAQIQLPQTPALQNESQAVAQETPTQEPAPENTPLETIAITEQPQAHEPAVEEVVVISEEPIITGEEILPVPAESLEEAQEDDAEDFDEEDDEEEEDEE